MHIRCRWCDIYPEDKKKNCGHSVVLKYVCYERRGRHGHPEFWDECDTCDDRFKCLTTRNWTEWMKEPEVYEASGRYKE